MLSLAPDSSDCECVVDIEQAVAVLGGARVLLGFAVGQLVLYRDVVVALLVEMAFEHRGSA